MRINRRAILWIEVKCAWEGLGTQYGEAHLVLGLVLQIPRLVSGPVDLLDAARHAEAEAVHGELLAAVGQEAQLGRLALALEEVPAPAELADLGLDLEVEVQVRFDLGRARQPVDVVDVDQPRHGDGTAEAAVDLRRPDVDGCLALPEPMRRAVVVDAALERAGVAVEPALASAVVDVSGCHLEEGMLLSDAAVRQGHEERDLSRQLFWWI